VQGYDGEIDYGFTRRAMAIGAYSIFVYPTGDSSSSVGSLGLSYTLGPKTSLTAAYQYLRDAPRDANSLVRHRFTAQFLLRF
jgi:hypothetical protein